MICRKIIIKALADLLMITQAFDDIDILKRSDSLHPCDYDGLILLFLLMRR